MAMMLFVLVLAYVIKNGVVDGLEAGHGRTPSRWVAAQKRADARIARATARSARYGKRAARYRAKAGRPPRRSSVRPYFKTLFHDAVDDARERHEGRRAARKAASAADPGLDVPEARARPDGAPGPDVKPRTRTDPTRTKNWTIRMRWPDRVQKQPLDLQHPPGIAVWDEQDLTRRTTGLDELVRTGELAGYEVIENEPDAGSWEHGAMHSTPSDGDQLATVTPISEGITPMSAPTAEVTGISSAIAWAQQTGEACTEAVTTTERVGAFFAGNEFDELAGRAAQMQERFGALAADCQEIVSELERFLSVKEQWAAVDNQGTKEAIVNE